MSKKPKKNTAEIDDLSAEANALHSRLTKEWSIRDGAGCLALLTLCQSVDRLRQAQGILKAEGCIVTDRWGQKKAHPATTIEREARAGLLASLKVLNLDLESLEVDE